MKNRRHKKYKSKDSRSNSKQPRKLAVDASSRIEQSGLIAPKREWKFSKFGWSIIGGASTVVALIIGFHQLRPMITIEPTISLDVGSPFATQFRISNSGYLSAYDVTFACRVDNQMMRGTVLKNNHGQETEKVIGPGDSATKNCSINSPGFSLPSDVEIITTYRYPLWPMSLSSKSRFVNMKDSDGHLRWVEEPVRN